MLFTPAEPVLPMSQIQGIVVPGFPQAAPDADRCPLSFPPARDASGQDISARIEGFYRQADITRPTPPPRSCPQREAVHHGIFKCLAGRSLQLPRFVQTGSQTRQNSQCRVQARHGGSLRIVGRPSYGPRQSCDLEGRWAEIGIGRTLRRRRKPSRSSLPVCDELTDSARSAGLAIVYYEHGDVRPDLRGHEHFGFNDGVSQPGISGRASRLKNDFITGRYITPGTASESRLFGYPGQDLVWPGAFLLGQPGAGPDPLIPGAVTRAVPDWTANGSFLVFRRLVQDVGLFWRTMRKLAHELSTEPGLRKNSWTARLALLYSSREDTTCIEELPGGVKP